MNFKNLTCTCDPAIMEDEVTRFAQQIVLELPKWFEYRLWRLSQGYPPTVCVDPCIVDAVKELWLQGIETTGCCCGHNNMPAWAGITEKHFEKALKLGYRQLPACIVPGGQHWQFTIYLKQNT